MLLNGLHRQKALEHVHQDAFLGCNYCNMGVAAITREDQDNVLLKISVKHKFCCCGALGPFSAANVF